MNFKKGLVILTLLTVVSFLPALTAEFVSWDDDSHVLSNAMVKQFDVKNLFFTKDSANHTYHPLTAFTWSLEYKLFGKSPMVFHLTNLILHIGVVLTVYVLAGRFGLGIWGAFVAALIFSIHPTRVENVAWVTARKDLLYGFFYLLAIGAYLSYLERSGRVKAVVSGPHQEKDKKTEAGFYLLALGCGFLSILSKPQALSLPWILLLVDWMRGRRFSASMLLDKIPFFLIIEPIAWITYSQNSREMTLNFPNGFLVWFWSAAFYIVKFIFPGNLSPVYGMPEPVAFSNPIYISVLVTLGVTVFILWRWASNRWLLFALSYYFLSLFFIWRFDWRDTSVVADRFIYIPAFAACLAVGYGFEYLMKKPKNVPKWTMAALAVVALTFSIQTFSYCFVWRNGFALWNRVVEASPELPFGYNNRGSYFMQHDEYEKAMKDFQKAIEVAGQSRIVKDGKSYLPFKAATHQAASQDNIGQLYAKQKNYEEALKHFNLAIYYDVENAEYFNNRAITLVKLNRMNEAISDYNAALSIKPEFYEAHLNRGIYFYKVGKKKEALDDFNQAIVLDSGHSEAYMQAGRIDFENNDLDKALEKFKKVEELEPDNAQALFNIGLIYTKMKNKELAQKYFSQAQVKWIKDPEKYELPGLNPKDAKIWANRTKSMDEMKDLK
jgi:protein O-mannosyl-transferase